MTSGEHTGQTAVPNVGRVAPIPSGWGQLPTYFVENLGQADPRVGFYASVRGGPAYFTNTGVTYTITGRPGAEIAHYWQDAAPPDEGDPDPQRRWAVKVEWLGADQRVRPAGLDQTPAIFSYFKGRPEQWTTAAPTYSGVVYSGAWPGVDIVYGAERGSLKSTYIVAPGADPGQIALGYTGQHQLRILEDGSLLSETPLGLIRETAPVTFQEIDGLRVEIPSAYTLREDVELGASVVGFQVGAYDTSEPLVIDPAVLVFSGYIGGSANDQANGVGLDASGSVYVGGLAASTEATFPEVGGPDLVANGDLDAFVAKLTPTGDGLVYAGFIGGTQRDQGADLAVDGDGFVYLTGSTQSDQGLAIPFPISGGAFDTTHNGSTDIFVTKVSVNGAALVYSTYIGGSSLDTPAGVALEPGCQANCAVYLAGTTVSGNLFPSGLTGVDATFNTVSDAFALKLDASGGALVYGGYIGGSGEDQGGDIAVDATGAAYIVGKTPSTQATFPNGSGFGAGVGQISTPGFDQTHNGNADAFVVKLNPAGSSYVYATYLGGGGADGGDNTSIAVDANGQAYVSGQTVESGAPFPRTVGPDLTPNGSNDAFITKLNAAGTGLVYSGFIGGSGDEDSGAVALDSQGAAYVGGHTNSTAAQGFPIVNSLDAIFGGNQDVFLAKVRPDGSGFEMTTYHGGTDLEQVRAQVVDANGTVTMVGVASSSEAQGFPAVVGPDLTANGGTEGFVARLHTTTDLNVSITDSPDGVAPGQNVTYLVTVSNVGLVQATNVSVTSALPAGSTLVSATPSAGACGPNVAGVITCNLTTIETGGALRTLALVVQAPASGPLSFTATASAAEGEIVVANNTATETTVVGSACGPRPNVLVQTTPGAPGSLNVAVTAQTSATTTANGLVRLRFVSTTNAVVDILGQTGRSGEFTVELPGAPSSVNFVVRFTPRGQSSTVRFVAVDACGDWPTFVGGGPSVTQ